MHRMIYRLPLTNIFSASELQFLGVQRVELIAGVLSSERDSKLSSGFMLCSCHQAGNLKYRELRCRETEF